MGNVKKSFILGLASICVCTNFVGAAFTDQASIDPDNSAAVDALTNLGIINGFIDGSFQPHEPVSRAQMCKMIYAIRNGGNDDASAYENKLTSFKDVDGHWASGYIKCLQDTGIVAGKSDDVFDPDTYVTTGEAYKMALVLGGYRADKAGLIGEKWLDNTVSFANTNRLTHNVNSGIREDCTRQDAAQILANTLNMTAVEWNEAVDGFVNDDEVGANTTTVGLKWMRQSADWDAFGQTDSWDGADSIGEDGGSDDAGGSDDVGWSDDAGGSDDVGWSDDAGWSDDIGWSDDAGESDDVGGSDYDEENVVILTQDELCAFYWVNNSEMSTAKYIYRFHPDGTVIIGDASHGIPSNATYTLDNGTLTVSSFYYDGDVIFDYDAKANTFTSRNSTVMLERDRGDEYGNYIPPVTTTEVLTPYEDNPYAPYDGME